MCRLGSLPSSGALQWFILAGNSDWKLQVLPSLAAGCDFQHGLDRGTGTVSEINRGLGEYGSWLRLPLLSIAKKRNVLPPLPCTLKKDVLKWDNEE